MLCAIWYYLYNSKREKHLWRSVTFTPATLLKVSLLRGSISRFLNCANGTKSSEACHLLTGNQSICSLTRDTNKFGSNHICTMPQKSYKSPFNHVCVCADILPFLILAHWSFRSATKFRICSSFSYRHKKIKYW